MIVYPMLEILGGKCVSLVRGRLEEPEIWHIDPVKIARGFAAAGAEWMHITDFDALSGDTQNDALIEEIIRAAGIPVQLGGGFRSRERVQQWIEKGVGRVVMGTVGVRDPDLVMEMAKYHPDQIVLSVDVFQGQIMSEGWRQPSALDPETYLRAFDSAPLAGVIVTDINSDIDELDGQLGVISGLAAATRHPVIARGVVRDPDDIARLKYIRNISGTIVGKALMNKSVTLEDALAIARPEPEPIAPFQ